MSVKGFKNYDEEGNFLGVEKYDYGSLENIPKNFKNDTYEQDIRQLKTDVEKNVTDHNVSKDAHNDIRLLITEIINRINVIADSDDETLDQMSELVAFIKNNKTLIDSITTSKVNVSDIVNDLTTNVSNKPLSAEQGVVLKTLIDNLTRDLDTHGLSGNHIPTGGSSGQILKWLSSGKAQWAKETVYASTTHKHSANDVTSGTLPISRGGTGGTSAKDAAKLLGVPSLKGAKILGDDITDLDTVGVAGTYSCYASGALSRLSNCPTNKKAFVMYVESESIHGSASIYTTQIIRDINGNIFYRKLRVGTDTGVTWKCIGGGGIKLDKTYMFGKNETYKGITINWFIVPSLNMGFIFLYGVYEGSSTGGSFSTTSSKYTSPMGTIYFPVEAIYEDNSYADCIDVSVGMTPSSSGDKVLKCEIIIGKNMPKGTKISCKGFYLLEPK